LAPAHLRRRDEPGEVAVAGLVGGDQDEPRRVGRDVLGRARRPARPDGLRGGGLQRELGAAQRGEMGRGYGGLGEPDRPVEPVPGGQRDPAQPQRKPVLDQLLRVRGRLEEAEVRPAVELGILGIGHRDWQYARTYVRIPGYPAPSKLMQHAMIAHMASYDQDAKLVALVQALRDEYTRATTTYPFDQCWARIALHLVARGVIANLYLPDFDVSEVLENVDRPSRSASDAFQRASGRRP